MRTLLILLVFSVSFPIFAQDCEYELNDNATGNVVKVTKYMKIWSSPGTLQIKGMNYNGEYFLKIKMGKSTKFLIDKDSEMTLTLYGSNGVTLKAENKAIAVEEPESAVWYAEAKYPVSAEEFKSLSDVYVSAISITTSAGVNKNELKDKKGIEFSGLLRCVK
jgi:hypothetical protein